MRAVGLLWVGSEEGGVRGAEVVDVQSGGIGGEEEGLGG